MSSSWDNKVGIGRLTFLGFLPPPVPAGVPRLPNEATEDPDLFLHGLREHARATVDPELLEDRKEIWEGQWDDVAWTPAWMTLEPQPDLRNYEGILTKDLKLDKRALDPFVSLVRRGDRGYSEACRALAHGFKDKQRGPHDTLRFNVDEYGRDKDPEAKSKWFKSAAEESLDALDDPDIWEKGPEATMHLAKQDWSKGKSKGGKKGWSSRSWYENASTWQGTSSSSSSTWEPGKSSGENPWASYTGATYQQPQDDKGASKGASKGFTKGWRPS